MEHVCGRLVAAFDAYEYPYNQPHVRPPQEPENLPTTLVLGSRDHAMFLFNLCYWMRGGIQSDTAAKSLGQVYLNHPELFDPTIAKSASQRKIERVFTEYGLGWSKSFNSRFWISNSKFLVERWGADPRNIYHDFGTMSEKESWQEACKRIKKQGKIGEKGGFAGFREKMVSMLTYFLMYSQLIPSFNFPLPIDFHILRMSIIHGIVKVESGNGAFNYADELLSVLRNMTYRYATEHDVTSLKLCDVLWLYSRSMCSNHPSFKSTVGERNGRSTLVFPPVLTWNKAQVLAHQRTCEVCHVADTCSYVVRSAPYYIQGKLMVEAKSSFPQNSLFSNEESRRLLKGGEEI